METWEVEARVAITDLVARYNAAGDSARFDRVMELFTDDAVMVIDGTTHAGHDAIRGIFTSAKTRVNSGRSRPAHVRHFTATHQVDFTSETKATGLCYFQVLTPVGLDHWGRYVDDYDRVDGRWRFASRRVDVDGYAKRSLFRP
jgi:hypothetical protein